MADLRIDRRGELLEERIRQMRENDAWHLFQTFCCRCLAHMRYADVRPSKVRGDFGRDAVAVDPQGRPCFVAISFRGDRRKVMADAKRWSEDPNREPAEVMVFMTWDGARETQLSKWREEIKKKYDVRLVQVHEESLVAAATPDDAWYEVCDLLDISDTSLAFWRIRPYDSDRVRRRLNVRPPEILATPLPRRELAGQDWTRNRLVFGKPGAGKTTAIFLALEELKPEVTYIVERDFREHAQAERLAGALAERGGVVVFDDIQERPEGFKAFCGALLARRPQNVLLLVAARSTDWHWLQRELPTTHLQDLGLTDHGILRLADLTADQCRQLVVLCRDGWGLKMEDRLVDIAARSAAAGDASPLYVISLLAPARGREPPEVTDTDVAGVPKGVRELWTSYFDRLDAAPQAVLRLVKLFWSAEVTPHRHLLDAAGGKLGLGGFEIDGALKVLERTLWVSRASGAPRCLDAQIEAIPLSPDDYGRWDAFVDGFAGGRQTHIQLRNGTGSYYYQVRRARSGFGEEYRQACEASLVHFEAALRISTTAEDRAMFLGNACVARGYLASLETTREGRRKLLEKAIAYAEEAIAIRRQLGLQANVATSLNNASNRYSELASLETTREGRRKLLEKAIAYAREAIAIYRQLGLQANVAGSLNNASNRYSDLASLESTREGRRKLLEKAIAYAEEAIAIRRQLGLQANVAGSLNNASTLYSELASLETGNNQRLALLEKAAAASREAVEIFRQTGNPARFLISLENGVRHSVLLAAAKHERIDDGVARWCDEGMQVASQYGDKDTAEWFAAVKASIERGELPEL